MRTFRVYLRTSRAHEYHDFGTTQAKNIDEVWMSYMNKQTGLKRDQILIEHEPVAHAEIVEIHQDAINVQDACNLSGVLHSFVRAMELLAELGLDTVAKAKHPVSVLYSSKIASLTGSERGFELAYKAAKIVTGQEEGRAPKVRA